MNIRAQSAALRRLASQLAHDPDDLIQDAWVDALRSPPDDEGTRAGWLRRVLRNRGITNRRARVRRETRERAADRPEAPPSSEQLQLLRQLLEQIAALPQTDQDLLVMHYWEGATLQECATRMGLTASTVRSRHARALDKLRARLDERTGGRKAWLSALAPWLPPQGPPLELASLSVGGVLAGALLWSLAALDPACDADAVESASPEDAPVAARAPAPEADDAPAHPRGFSRHAIDFDADPHPCDPPIAAEDSPTMAAIIESGRIPTRPQVVQAHTECILRHGPPRDYRATQTNDDGAVHPLLSAAMSLQHVWPAMRQCHDALDPAHVRLAFSFLLEEDGTMLVDDVRVEDSENLGTDALACAVSSVYVAEVDLRAGDPTMLGLEPGTRLSMPRLVEVELTNAVAQVVAAGHRPAGHLQVEKGFDDALRQCGSDRYTVSLHWDPETRALLDVEADATLDASVRACLHAAVRGGVKPLQIGFFPRTDADTHQTCTVEAGARPSCESEPMFQRIEG